MKCKSGWAIFYFFYSQNSLMKTKGSHITHNVRITAMYKNLHKN